MWGTLKTIMQFLKQFKKKYLPISGQKVIFSKTRQINALQTRQIEKQKDSLKAGFHRDGINPLGFHHDCRDSTMCCPYKAWYGAMSVLEQQAKNRGLLFVEKNNSKVAYDYNNGDNIEDGVVHKGLPFRFYRPQIDDNRQYSGKNIESQKVHWFLSFFDNATDMLKKDSVIAMPIENVSHGFMPVAPGTNAPTTKEANRIFAPSKKKSETISSLSLSIIPRKFTTRSAICQDKERRNRSTYV